jgi:hypothetical protein
MPASCPAAPAGDSELTGAPPTLAAMDGNPKRAADAGPPCGLRRVR